MDKKPSLINKNDFDFPGSDPMNVHRHGSDKLYIDPSEYIVLNRKLTQFPLFRRNAQKSKTIPLNKPFNSTVKRLMDIIFATLVIVLVLSWLIPLFAFFIKIDSGGPIFFLQKRKKKNGKTFTCLKFRTMFVGLDIDILPNCNEERITKLGRFMRRYHIDELPQFFNVWWGDMSVIGPRPHMVLENLKYERLVQDYSLRHMIKPGITGLAQVLGYAGSTDLQKIRSRVYLDIHYIRHWSLLLDLKIMWYTILSFRGIHDA